jgi:hypothetical protein
MNPVTTPRLRRQAMRYVRHGWALAPGAWWTRRRRYQCTTPGCLVAGLHPCDHPGDALAASTNVARVAVEDPVGVKAVWGDRPYSLLLPTGRGIDVIEVPIGAMRLPPPPSLGAPVAIKDGDGARRCWLIFARSGDPVAPETRLRQVPGLVIHQAGSWVPIPPSPVRGRLTWLRPPESTGWEMPTLNVALAAVDNRLGGHLSDIIPAPRRRVLGRRGI